MDTEVMAAKRTQYHHGDLRAGLVEATRQLVEEKGADRFSVSDACRAAGVSTAAPYRHFEDRDEMLVAVCFEGMERFQDLMLKALKGHAHGSLEAIIALGHSYIQFATSEPGVFRLSFGIGREHGDNIELAEQGMRIYGIVLEQVAAYFGKNDVDDDVLDRAFPLWTMVHGLSFLLIDEKMAMLNLDHNIDAMIRDNTRRLLAD
ncbi:MAG: TetR/AcrR family transcriptional regulator [Pseudomonadota bacterium]